MAKIKAGSMKTRVLPVPLGAIRVWEKYQKILYLNPNPFIDEISAHEDNWNSLHLNWCRVFYAFLFKYFYNLLW